MQPLLLTAWYDEHIIAVKHSFETPRQLLACTTHGVCTVAFAGGILYIHMLQRIY